MRKLSLFCAVTLLSLSARAAGSSSQPAKAPASQAAQQAAPSAQAPAADDAVPDTAAALAAMDPTKKADIQRLVAVAGMKDTLSKTLDAMQGNMRSMLISNLPPGDYREKLADLFIQKFRSKLDMQQLVDIAIVTYDKYLSDDDIKGLTQFYQTPLGQKTLTVVPNVAASMQAAGQSLGEKAGRESMLEVLAEHPEIEKQMQDAVQQAPQR